MINEKKVIPQKALKRLLKITTSDFGHFDVKNKLEMMAVKAGIKPVFLGIPENPYFPILKWAATLLDLKYKLTNLPPPYFSRRPNVDQGFLNAWGGDEEAIWIYRDVQAEPMISASVAGRLNGGHVLGYPPCCIKWHEDTRACELEAQFQDIQEYIARNPPELMNFQRKTEEEMYSAILKTSFPERHTELLFKSIEKHIIGTYERYPFAPHWACSSCLSGESKETERLNDKYKELAIKLDPKFAKKIVQTLLKFVKSCEID